MMMMNYWVQFLVVSFFVLAALAFLAWAANCVLTRLVDVSRRSMTYYDYRKFLHRCAAMPDLPDHQDFWPVPVSFATAKHLERMKADGFRVCGLVVEFEGKTLELYATGEIVHTGISYQEGKKH